MYIGNDGSGFCGAKNLQGAVQGFNVDVLGNLLVSSGAINPTTISGAQVFSASTGLLNSGAGTNNYALSVFNPSTSGKNVLIYSIQVANGSGGMTAILQRVTVDPGFTAVTPLNAKLGGAASTIAGHVSQATSNQTLSGTYDQVLTLASVTQEMLTNGAMFLLPNGSSEGLVQYVQTYAAAINSILIRWLEF